jgi:hypothetical protein
MRERAEGFGAMGRHWYLRPRIAASYLGPLGAAWGGARVGGVFRGAGLSCLRLR